jgi:hypothetical protein
MGHAESDPKLLGKNCFMTLVPHPVGKRKRKFFSDHELELADVEEEDDEELTEEEKA